MPNGIPEVFDFGEMERKEVAATEEARQEDLMGGLSEDQAARTHELLQQQKDRTAAYQNLVDADKHLRRTMQTQGITEEEARAIELDMDRLDPTTEHMSERQREQWKLTHPPGKLTLGEYIDSGKAYLKQPKAGLPTPLSLAKTGGTPTPQPLPYAKRVSRFAQDVAETSAAGDILKSLVTEPPEKQPFNREDLLHEGREARVITEPDSGKKRIVYTDTKDAFKPVSAWNFLDQSPEGAQLKKQVENFGFQSLTAVDQGVLSELIKQEHHKAKLAGSVAPSEMQKAVAEFALGFAKYGLEAVRRTWEHDARAFYQMMDRAKIPGAPQGQSWEEYHQIRLGEKPDEYESWEDLQAAAEGKSWKKASSVGLPSFMDMPPPEDPAEKDPDKPTPKTRYDQQYLVSAKAGDTLAEDMRESNETGLDIVEKAIDERLRSEVTINLDPSGVIDVSALLTEFTTGWSRIITRTYFGEGVTPGHLAGYFFVTDPGAPIFGLKKNQLLSQEDYQEMEKRVTQKGWGYTGGRTLGDVPADYRPKYADARARIEMLARHRAALDVARSYSSGSGLVFADHDPERTTQWLTDTAMRLQAKGQGWVVPIAIAPLAAVIPRPAIRVRTGRAGMELTGLTPGLEVHKRGSSFDWVTHLSPTTVMAGALETYRKQVPPEEWSLGSAADNATLMLGTTGDYEKTQQLISNLRQGEFLFEATSQLAYDWAISLGTPEEEAKWWSQLGAVMGFLPEFMPIMGAEPISITLGAMGVVSRGVLSRSRFFLKSATRLEELANDPNLTAVQAFKELNQFNPTVQAVVNRAFQQSTGLRNEVIERISRYEFQNRQLIKEIIDLQDQLGIKRSHIILAGGEFTNVTDMSRLREAVRKDFIKKNPHSDKYHIKAQVDLQMEQLEQEAAELIMRQTYDGDVYKVYNQDGVFVERYERMGNSWWRGGVLGAVEVEARELFGARLVEGQEFVYGVDVIKKAELEASLAKSRTFTPPPGTPPGTQLDPWIEKMQKGLAAKSIQQADNLLKIAQEQLEFAQKSQQAWVGGGGKIYANVLQSRKEIAALERELKKLRKEGDALVRESAQILKSEGEKAANLYLGREAIARREFESASKTVESLTGIPYVLERTEKSRKLMRTAKRPHKVGGRILTEKYYLWEAVPAKRTGYPVKPTAPAASRKRNKQIKAAKARLKAAAEKYNTANKAYMAYGGRAGRNYAKRQAIFQKQIALRGDIAVLKKSISVQLPRKGVQTTLDDMLAVGRQHTKTVNVAKKAIRELEVLRRKAEKHYKKIHGEPARLKAVYEKKVGRHVDVEGKILQWREVFRETAKNIRVGVTARKEAPARIKKFKDILKRATVKTAEDGSREIRPHVLIGELQDEFGHDVLEYVIKKAGIDPKDPLAVGGVRGGAVGDVLAKVFKRVKGPTGGTAIARLRGKIVGTPETSTMMLTKQEVLLLHQARDLLQRNWKAAHPESAAMAVVDAIEISQKYDPDQLKRGLRENMFKWSANLRYLIGDAERARFSGLAEDMLNVWKGSQHTQDRISSELIAIAKLADKEAEKATKHMADSAQKELERSEIFERMIIDYFTKNDPLDMRGESTWFHGQWNYIRAYILSSTDIFEKEAIEYKRTITAWETWLDAPERTALEKKMTLDDWAGDFAPKSRVALADPDSVRNELHAISRTWIPRRHIAAGTSTRVTEGEAAQLYVKAYELLRDEKNLGTGDSMGAFFQALEKSTQGHRAPKVKRKKGERKPSRVDVQLSKDPERVRSLAMGAIAMGHAFTAAKTREATMRAIGGFISPGQAIDVSRMLTGSVDKVTDFSGTLEVMNRFGLPFTQTEAKYADRTYKTRLASMGKDPQGREFFLPEVMHRQQMEKMDKVTKSVQEKYAAARTPEEIFMIGREWDMVRLWKTSMVTGLVIPKSQHWINNFVGDFSQMMFEFGPRTATKVNFQLIAGAPGWNKWFYTHELVRKAGKFGEDHHLGGVFNAMFNPDGQKIWRGETGSFRTRAGAEYDYDLVRQMMTEYGILDTMVHEELLQQFTNVMPDFYQKFLKSPGISTGVYLRDTIGWMAQFVQQRQRGNLFMELLNKGYEPREAARLTKQALYDWKHALAKWEISTIAKFIPYYRFWKLALKQASRVVTDPFVKPTETMIKALKAQSPAARLRQQQGLFQLHDQLVDPKLDKQWQNDEELLRHQAHMLRADWSQTRHAKLYPSTDPFQYLEFKRTGRMPSHAMALGSPWTILDAWEMGASVTSAMLASAGHLDLMFEKTGYSGFAGNLWAKTKVPGVVPIVGGIPLKGIGQFMNPTAMGENFWRPIADIAFPQNKALIHAIGGAIGVDTGGWKHGTMARISQSQAFMLDKLGVATWAVPLAGVGALMGAQRGQSWLGVASGALVGAVGGFALNTAFPAKTQYKVDPKTGEPTDIIVASYGTKALLDLLPLLQNEVFRVLDPVIFENPEFIRWWRAHRTELSGFGMQVNIPTSLEGLDAAEWAGEAAGRYTTKGAFRAAGAEPALVPEYTPGRFQSSEFRTRAIKEDLDRRLKRLQLAGEVSPATIIGDVREMGMPEELQERWESIEESQPRQKLPETKEPSP